MRLAALCAAVLLTARHGVARGDDAPAPAVGQRPAPTVIAEVLRRSRLADAPPADDLVEEIALVGDAGIEPTLGMLVRRKVDVVAEGQQEQILSVPQRELLLAALARWPAEPVLAAAERLVQDPPAAPAVAATIHVYSAVGETRQLVRALELAAVTEEIQRDDGVSAALQQATTRILLRQPRGLTELVPVFQKAPQALHRSVLLGVGATRDPRSAEFFTRVLEFDDACAPIVLAQLKLTGRPADAQAARGLIDEVRGWLDAPSPTTRSAAVRALAELRDWESVDEMLTLLEGDDRPLRETALWSLQRLSGLDWRDSLSWRSWYQRETRWLDKRSSAVLKDLDHRDPNRVAKALREIGDHPLFGDLLAPHVADVLQSARGDLRACACAVLAQLDSPTSYGVLVDTLLDSDTAVRSAAHTALTRLTKLELPPDQDAWRKALPID